MSTFGNIAVGIGTDTEPDATAGLFGGAFAIGNRTDATVIALYSTAIAAGLTNRANSYPVASSASTFDAFYAGGEGANAHLTGTLGAAFAQGQNGGASGGDNKGDTGNVAINDGNDLRGDPNAGTAASCEVGKPGFGTVAVSLGNIVKATGALSNAAGVGGNDNFVLAGGVGTAAATCPSLCSTSSSESHTR